MIHLQMIYFNQVDEHDKTIERWHQPMKEKFRCRKELDDLRQIKVEGFAARGMKVEVRFQYLTVEE